MMEGLIFQRNKIEWSIIMSILKMKFVYNYKNEKKKDFQDDHRLI